MGSDRERLTLPFRAPYAGVGHTVPVHDAAEHVDRVRGPVQLVQLLVAPGVRRQVHNVSGGRIGGVCLIRDTRDQMKTDAG